MNPFNYYGAAYIGALTFYIMDLLTHTVSSSNVALSSSTTLDNRKNEFRIDPEDDYAIKQLSIIVDALENLAILGKDKQNCYMVDKISKQSQNIGTDRLKVGIEFYITRLQPSIIEKLNKSFQQQGNGGVVSDLSNVNISQSAQNSTPPSVCQYVKILQDKEISYNNSDINLQNTNSTVAAGSEEAQKKDWREKLSHTQIMVISTCSAVIGIFFIIAMIMRVRNYLKRKSKQDRESRSQFSSSLALRSGRHSPARTESIASKSGCLDSKLSLTSNPHINHNGSALNNHYHQQPHHKDVNHTAALDNKPLLAGPPNNKPLLVITSASAPSSPLTYASQIPNRNGKKKIGQSPSFPLDGSRNNKDYLTIDRTLPTKRNNTQQPEPNIQDTDKSNQTSTDKFKKRNSLNMQFKEYYRESRSSDSSMSEGPKQSNSYNREDSTSSRKDSSTSNQSGYETSQSSITTDSSLPINQKVNIIDNNEEDNCENDDVFDENAINNKPLPPDNLPLSVLLPNDPEQREKRMSSSSSYGRKSVSFSLDVKVEDIHDSQDSFDDDDEDNDLLSDNTPGESSSMNENSLLLRPEFLGMEPTYV